MSTKELVKLYRECEAEKAKWGDAPVDLEYFIDWLEGREAQSTGDKNE